MTMLFSISTPILVLIAMIFVIYRLRFFADEEVSGRYLFLSGGILLLVASIWQTIKSLTDYTEWFVENAYPFIDLAQLLVFVGGVLLVIAGLALYADYWQTRRDELTIRDQRLSILTNLQNDAREPYQLVELLNLSLKEIISHLSETAGGVFLVNRGQRQLVMTAAVALTKQETAVLERYPYGQNLVTQAVEAAEPIISGSFEFAGTADKPFESRFNSCLILPLVSGIDRLGVIVLLSEKEHFFTRNEIKYLSPVTDWLAEKIKTTRLTRELSTARRDLEEYTLRQNDLSRRIIQASSACGGNNAITSFCGSLVGLAESQSVQMVGMKNGSLHFYGGSEPLWELTENYRTALIDALGRRKPLIINQEATGEQGRPFIARSTLIYPLKNGRDDAALLFVKEASAFKVNENDLNTIDIYTHLARLSLEQEDFQRLDLTRRKGLEKVLQLLRFDEPVEFSNDPGYLAKHVASILPSKSIALTFMRQPEGSYRVADAIHAKPELYDQLVILPGEGIIGTVVGNREAEFVLGRTKVVEMIKAFDETNRDALYKLFGDKGIAGFGAVLPISHSDVVVGAMLLFIGEVSESEYAEWERLLTLAASLYSVRLTISQLYQNQTTGAVKEVNSGALASVVNKLNNHLSAIVGSAQLASLRTDLSGDVRNHFRTILSEAESAAAYIKNSLGRPATGSDKSMAEKETPNETLNDIIESVLNRSRISENVYMVGGRPREIDRAFNDIQPIEFAAEAMRNLFEEAINRFASLADDEDIITVSTYHREGYVYLDISRHHKNFPPVQQVASFGQYQLSQEVLKYRPSDTFLKHTGDRTAFYSYDRLTGDPSYLSFKLPLKQSPVEMQKPAGRPRILAIDDQDVILDLVQAMCQSSGYDVTTVSSPDQGLAMALREKYDLILTDLAMPGLSGMELAREVRKKKPTVPIVLITGWGFDIKPDQLEAAGITATLYKPFRIEQLTEIVDTLVGPRSRR